MYRCALFDSQYTPNTLEAGIINLGVAENSLMTDWLIAYYENNFSLTYTDFTYGTSLAGSHRLFSALELLTTNYFNSKIPVKRSDVCAGSGCGSVIDLLVSCLADAGEG